MTASDTPQKLLNILTTIDRMVGTDRIVVQDSHVATELSMARQDLRDYLDILEAEGKIQLWKSSDSYTIDLTPKGRMLVRDPSYTVQSSAATTINLSGSYQGAILNIQSTLANVSQTINAAPHITPAAKDELKALVDQLNQLLQHAPQEKSEEAEAVAESAKILVDAATKDKPNKTMVTISTEGLKKAAGNMAHVMPTILPIAMEIAKKIQLLFP